MKILVCILIFLLQTKIILKPTFDISEKIRRSHFLELLFDWTNPINYLPKTIKKLKLLSASSLNQILSLVSVKVSAYSCVCLYTAIHVNSSGRLYRYHNLT